MTMLWLVRHGQTDWNVEGRWQGQADPPLNAVGKEQATQLAHALARVGLTAIYASDLRRAHETALALGRITGLEVQLDYRLREMDQGTWEGRLGSEVQAQYPEALKRRRESPLTAAAPGGETVQQVSTRVLGAVREILARHPAEAVAIVSHGLALAVIRVAYQGHPLEQVWDLIPGNGEILPIQCSVAMQR